MRFFRNVFKKKNKKEQNTYAKLGSIGVSPSYMLMYQDSIKKIKEFETNYK